MQFPRVVFFDLDDTLITNNEALERALASVYPNYPELGAAYDLQGLIGAWKESLRWDYKNVPGDKLSEHQRRINRILKIWGPVESNASDAFCGKVAAECPQVYQENWNLHKDVLAMLDDFAGDRMGVVTNGYVTQQNQKLRQLRVDRYFRTVVTSEEAGVGKPAPVIFQLACQRLKVQPSDAVYVGDLLETDALGAQNAGLTGIWLNRADEHDERSSQVRTITSLAALKRLFS